MNGKVDVPQGPGFTSIKRPCKRMACVLNTDTSNGSENTGYVFSSILLRHCGH